MKPDVAVGLQGAPGCSGCAENKPKTRSVVRSPAQVVGEAAASCLSYSCSAERQGAVISEVDIVFVHVMAVIYSWQHRAVSYILTPKEQEMKLCLLLQSRAEPSELKSWDSVLCGNLGLSWNCESPSFPYMLLGQLQT